MTKIFNTKLYILEEMTQEELNELALERNTLQQRINKAIEYIENYMPYVVETDKEYEDVNGNTYFTYKEYTGEEIIKILKGKE